jgi:hypothetical protein
MPLLPWPTQVCRWAPVVGHDRLDEFLVVPIVVSSSALQLLDSRDCVAPEQPGVSGDPNLTGLLDVRDPTIQRADELPERGRDGVRCRYAAWFLVSHRDTLTLHAGRWPRLAATGHRTDYIESTCPALFSIAQRTPPTICFDVPP